MSDFARTDTRPLVIAAHVDDDGVGFGMGIRDCAPSTTVVYLTDSAPRDATYFNAPAASRPTLYEAWHWPVTAEMLIAAFAALDAAP